LLTLASAFANAALAEAGACRTRSDAMGHNVAGAGGVAGRFRAAGFV